MNGTRETGKACGKPVCVSYISPNLLIKISIAYRSDIINST